MGPPLHMLAVLLANVAVVAAAEDPGIPIRLWPGEAPGDRPDTVGPEGYKRPDILTNVTVPTITPYLVAGSDAAMVIAPGGSYKVLSMFTEGSDIAAWLNSIGISAFLLKYRVPGRPWLPFGGAELMDAQRAMGLVRQMADSGEIIGKGLNKSKIGFIGFSAGGHLAGHLNVQWKNRTYPYTDAADKQSCRPDAAIMVYPWESVTEAPVNADVSQASAENITSDTPRTMLVQAEDDPVHVENALYYWLHLKRAKVLSELHLYPTGGHGYGRCSPHANSCTSTTSSDSLVERECNLTARPGVDQVCTWPGRGELFLQTVGIAPKAKKTETETFL